MGFQDRDYYRETTRHMYSDWFGQRATVGIIAVTTIVFLLQLASRFNVGYDRLSEFGAFHAPSIFQGEIWRLVTPVFLHSPFDPLHLLFNMFALYIFGSAVEAVYGSKEFVGFYFGAAFFGSLLELFIRGSGLADYDTEIGRVSGARIYGIGASGAVSAVAVLFACKFPHRGMQILFVPIAIPAWLLVSGYLVLDVAGVLRPRGNVNHIAHLCGAAFGLVYHFADLRITGRWPDFQRPRARPVLRLVPRDDDPDEITPPQPLTAPSAAPADEQFEARVDRVLEKMNAHGRESLSPEEHAVLLKASEIYKQKRRGT